MRLTQIPETDIGVGKLPNMILIINMSVGDKTIGIRHGPIGLACLSAIFHDGRLGSQLLTMTVIYYVNVSHQRES